MASHRFAACVLLSFAVASPAWAYDFKPYRCQVHTTKHAKDRKMFYVDVQAVTEIDAADTGLKEANRPGRCVEPYCTVGYAIGVCKPVTATDGPISPEQTMPPATGPRRQ